MISFKGFEIVPATGMFSTGVKQIRITVSAKKVGLSEQLLDALKHPAYISFHRGVGENEGKMIVAAAEHTGEPSEIQIEPGRKYAAFYNCDFVAMCDEMIRTYAKGAFRKGTYFSVAGSKMDEDGAVMFDFHNAEEHCVKVSKGTGAQRLNSNGFPMPQRVYSMPDRNKAQG